MNKKLKASKVVRSKRTIRRSKRLRFANGTPTQPKFDFKIPTNYESVEATFGKFDWHDLDNTRGADIAVDPKWVAANIKKIEILGVLPHPVYIHKRIAEVFKAALIEAAGKCPDYKITSCASFVPRHKRHDRKSALSLHSWAIAFDINPRMNPYGAYVHISKKPANDSPRVVNIYYDLPEEFISTLESYGFFWGGRFKSSKDPMHFQAAIKV